MQRRLLLATALGTAVATLALPASPASAGPAEGDQRELEQLLLDAVRSAGFEDTYDYGPIEGLCPASAQYCAHPAAKIGHQPDIDLAVIELDDDGKAVAAANVLVSRDFPDGKVVTVDRSGGPAGSYGVSSVRWRRWDIERADGGTFSEETGARLTTKSWSDPFAAGSDLVPGRERASTSFMSPYPASLFKIIVAFRIMRLVDAGTLTLEDTVPPRPAPPAPPAPAPAAPSAPATPATPGILPDGVVVSPIPPGSPATPPAAAAAPVLAPAAAQRSARTDESLATVHAGRIGDEPVNPTVRQAMFSMITYSDNEAARSLLRLLHKRGDLPAMQAELDALGLQTLQIKDTNPDTGGNWQPGSISMTSMDTARLLWLIEGGEGALWKRPDGKPVQASLLSKSSRTYLRSLLADQAYHEALSTTIFCGKPGVPAGIPAREPARWIDPATGTVTVDGYFYDNDVRPCNAAAEVTFEHKTGLTYNYGADAGIVRSLPGKPHRHYVISFISSLGYRYVDESFAGRTTTTPCEDATSPICYTQQIPAMARRIDAGLTGDR